MQAYRLSDEPQPGTLARFAVQPLWPLLGVMFVGPWLSWPWFAFNGAAVGSPTRQRELMIVAGGFAGSFALVIVLLILAGAELVAKGALPYLFTILVVWHLAVSYWLYVLQSRTFALYEYYGGVVTNGLPFVAVGFFLDGLLATPVESVGSFGITLRLALGI